MLFRLIEPPLASAANSRFDESLMRQAAQGQACASLWEAQRGLVVPRSYLNAPRFEQVCALMAASGWPVSIRHSGGGVVPQGPGILNISLAWAVRTTHPLEHTDAAYLRLGRLIQHALAALSIEARMQSVEGSFCDGRFNLAVGPEGAPKKIAGTAQLWRRFPIAQGGHTQVVLAHALLLVACDIDELTSRANALEAQLGQPRRYCAHRTTSVQCVLGRPSDASLLGWVRSFLQERLQHPLP